MSDDEAQFRKLQDALTDIGLEIDDAMGIEQLDGYLTGIILCPSDIPEARWFSHIWSKDGDSDQALQLAAQPNIQSLLPSICNHRDEVAHDLRCDDDRYGPVFAIDDSTGEVLWELWVDGFETAIALNPSAWLAVAESNDRPALEAFAGLRALAAIANQESTLNDTQQKQLSDQAPDLILQWAQTLARWRWQLARPMPLFNTSSQSSADATNKVGRNDPCPCGSGKKYKKCHGVF